MTVPWISPSVARRVVGGAEFIGTRSPTSEYAHNALNAAAFEVAEVHHQPVRVVRVASLPPPNHTMLPSRVLSVPSANEQPRISPLALGATRYWTGKPGSLAMRCHCSSLKTGSTGCRRTGRCHTYRGLSATTPAFGL